MRGSLTGPKALESLPLVFSESAVEQQLRDALPQRLKPQARREALMIAFALPLLAQTDLDLAKAGEDLPRRELPLESESLTRVLGIKAAAVRSASENLRRAGVWDEVRTQSGPKVRFSEHVCERSSSWGFLDWPRILNALAGDFGAVLLARVYARKIPPPFAIWTAVSNAEVGSHADLGRDAVRRARAVLLERGILEARKSAGQSDELRFSEFARGRGDRSAPIPGPPSAPVVRTTTEAPSSASAPPSPGAPSPSESGITLSVSGLSIAIPAGVGGRLEYLPDGSSRLHLGHLIVETDCGGVQTVYYGAVRLGTL